MVFIIKSFWTIVFVFIVISTTFRLLCPLAFFRCLSNSGTYTELRTMSFIESTEVACSDSVNSRRALKVSKILEHELVRDRIHNNRRKKHQRRSEISSNLTLFMGRISVIDHRTRIQQYLDKSYEQEFHMVMAREITKLEKIKSINMKIEAYYSPVEAIVNVSDS